MVHLIPLESRIIKDNTIAFTTELINSKIKDLFIKYDINKKYRSHHKDDNKQCIEYIYKENMKDIMEILEMSFFEVFSIFSGKVKNEKFEHMKKLDDMIQGLIKKGNDDKYIEKVKKVVPNFVNFYSIKIIQK